MDNKYLSKRVLAVIAMLGLVAMVTALLPAKPPPPKPHPKVHKHPKNHNAAKKHPKNHKALRHGHKRLPSRLRRVPPRRPVVYRRVGGAVVVKEGETIIQKTPTVVVESAEALQTVPVKVFDKTKPDTYKVVRVNKDCTVVLKREGKETTVRLLGVSPLAESGQAVNPYLENLLKGEFVYLDYDPTLAQQDETGQTIAYLYRAPDGMFLNLEIIRQGYGLAPDYYSYQHDKLFKFYQQKAQSDGKGIWSSVKTAAVVKEKTTPVTPASL